MRKRRTFLYLAPIGFLFFLVSCTNALNSEQPNILFVYADDHTSQAWGVYGGILEEYVVNENIKRLVQNGVLLNNSFCTNSICRPSRASLLTGKYGQMNGVYTLEEGLHPDTLNVAKLFQDGGYETAIFGKWFLHYEPSGFDHYMVMPWKGTYRDPRFKTPENWEDGEKGGVQYSGYSTDLITDFSIEWLKNRDSSRPFLLFTQFCANHEPFFYPERYKDLYKDDELPYPETLMENGSEETGKMHDGWPLEILGERYVHDSLGFYPGEGDFSLSGLSHEEARKKIYQKFVKDFLRCSAANDENLGKMIDYLEESGQIDNTIIIFTTDQGCFLGEHGYFDKRFIYEESLRIPFVISFPADLPSGERLDDMILDIDIPATLLDLAGLEIPKDMQGRSFRDNLKGNTPDDWRDAMYYRYWINEPERPSHLGIRDERFKLVFFYGQSLYAEQRDSMPYGPGWEFYDLHKDPKEKRNAIHDPVYAQLIDSLKLELVRLKTQMKDDQEKNPVIRKILEEELPGLARQDRGK
ncbi:MAG: sulfatase/phosphatase domain-containing protein [Bacteroidota bacterium]